MSLFRKKKDVEKGTCSCDSSCTAETVTQAEEGKAGIEVQVLGSGCAKCNTLESVVKEALEELHMETTIEHVTDFAQIAAYGVMSTPALVLNGKVVSAGRILKKQEVLELLKRGRGVHA